RLDLLGRGRDVAIERLAPRSGTDAADVEEREVDAGLAHPQRRERRAHDHEDGLRGGGELADPFRPSGQVMDLDRDAWGRRQLEDLAQELVAGGLVVDDDDPLRAERPEPDGHDLPVDESIVDSDEPQGHPTLRCGFCLASPWASASPGRTPPGAVGCLPHGLLDAARLDASVRALRPRATSRSTVPASSASVHVAASTRTARLTPEITVAVRGHNDPECPHRPPRRSLHDRAGWLQILAANVCRPRLSCCTVRLWPVSSFREPEGMSKSGPLSDREVMRLVAELYYERDLGKPEVAAMTGFSVSKVSRLLSAARAQGIVHITVEP